MARARNIKPGFYKNEDLAECSVWARFIFPGLWMLADREGRLEDRPKRIKGELLPFDSQDVEPLLRELSARGFIERYQVNGVSYLQITKFSTHQTPHYSEKSSVIMGPQFQETEPIKKPALQENVGHIEPTNSRKSTRIKRGSQPPDSLNPDSPILRLSDSPNPEPGFKTKQSQKPTPGASPPVAAEPVNGMDSEPKSKPVWQAYGDAYERRYGTSPVQNLTTRSQMAQFCKRIAAAEAPAVAAFYVGSNRGFYVQNRHSVGLLLRDAEGLRTEWATGVNGTDTEARQADRTQATGNAFAPLIAEAQERERIANGTK